MTDLELQSAEKCYCEKCFEKLKKETPLVITKEPTAEYPKVVAEIDLSNSDHGYTLPTAKWREGLEKKLGNIARNAKLGTDTYIKELENCSKEERGHRMQASRFPILQDKTTVGFVPEELIDLFEEEMKEALQAQEEKHKKEMEELKGKIRERKDYPTHPNKQFDEGFNAAIDSCISIFS